jgi:sporulation protein YlmC with PRC-barrel domain
VRFNIKQEVGINMKIRTRNKILAYCVAITLTAPALGYAADQSSQQSPQQGQQQAPVQYNQSSTLGGSQGLAMQPGQKQVLFKASRLVGQNVSSPQGQNLGKLSEIVFGPSQGIFAVIERQDQWHAVPWDLVTAVTDNSVVINTTSTAMSSSPQLKKDQNFASFNDPQFTKQLFSYYGLQQQQGMGSPGASTQQSGTQGQTSSSQGQSVSQGGQTGSSGQSDSQSQEKEDSDE